MARDAGLPKRLAQGADIQRHPGSVGERIANFSESHQRFVGDDLTQYRQVFRLTFLGRPRRAMIAAPDDEDGDSNQLYTML